MLNLFLLKSSHILCMLIVSACIFLTFERKEILDQSNFDAFSMHDFSNQNKLQQKCHQLWFSKFSVKIIFLGKKLFCLSLDLLDMPAT